MSSEVQEHKPPAPEAAAVNGWTGERAYSMYGAQTSFLLGKVLTTIDAAVTERQQNKAVKDLIKQQFRDQEKRVSEICCSGSRLICAAGEEMPPTQ